MRARSEHWANLRRNQDYYDEGALFWMEADAIIREKSDGKRSLDDFCRAFFAVRSAGRRKVVPFDLDEIVESLEAQAEYDWRGLIERRIHRPQPKLPLDVIWHAGYKLDYVAKRPQYVARRESRWRYVVAADTLGLTLFADDGRVTDVVPGRLADKAGIAQKMKIVGVNDKKYSQQRFRDAIADSKSEGGVKLLALDGETFRTFQLPYDAGSRYLVLKRDESRRDWLKEICKPRTGK